MHRTHELDVRFVGKFDFVAFQSCVCSEGRMDFLIVMNTMTGLFSFEEAKQYFIFYVLCKVLFVENLGEYNYNTQNNESVL